MGVAAHVFAGLKAAPENWMDADGVKIIRGYDASDSALGAIAEAERGAHDFGHDKGVDERAALLQVEQVGPGDTGRASLAASGSGEGEEPFLMSYERIGTEEDAFDPTENRGIGADSQGQAQNRQDRKPGTA